MGKQSRRSWRRRASVACVACLVLITGGLVLDVRGWIESRVFYFPSADVGVTPPGVEDVMIDLPEGGRLHAWYRAPVGWREGDPPVPAILHVHGNAGSVSDHAPSSAFLGGHGYGVLVFDYRGFGRSSPVEGRMSRRTLLADAHGALDALLARDDVDSSRVGVFGFSLGGVIGTALAAERDEVRAVVAVAPFSSWKGVASDHGGVVGSLAIRSGLDVVDTVALLDQRPLLVVHGSDDEIVPARHATLIEEAASTAGVPVDVLLTPGAGHNDVMFGGVEVERKVVELYDRALAAPSGAEQP